MANGEVDQFGLPAPYPYAQPLPPELTARQQWAMNLLKEGQAATPVTHPLAAFARALQGFTGGQQMRELSGESQGLTGRAASDFMRAAGIGGAPVAAPAAAPAPTMAPLPSTTLSGPEASALGRMVRVSAQGETGAGDFSKQANISSDTGGSKSYGVLGVNSGFGPNAGKGSAAQFAAQYPSLGLTATPGTTQFDAQWKAAAATMPDQLKAAQMDWFQKTILPATTEGLTKAGVPAPIAADPRVQTYFADRTVQQGPASTANHAQRIQAALAASGGTPEGFLRAMSAEDRKAIPGDFRTYLSARPQDVPGLSNRVGTRERLALETGTELPPGATPAQYVLPGGQTAPAGAARPLGAQPTVSPELAASLSNPYLPAPLRQLGMMVAKQQLDGTKYELHYQPNGTVIAINPKDPRDRQVIDTNQADALIRFKAAEAGAEETARGKAKIEITRENARPGQERTADLMTQDINRAINKINEMPARTTGLGGKILSNIPGTEAHDLYQTLTSIRANMGFAQLQEMRQNSPTGGALGQVSDFENRLLASAWGSVEQSQTPEQLTRNLRRVETLFQDIVHRGIKPPATPGGPPVVGAPPPAAPPATTAPPPAYRQTGASTAAPQFDRAAAKKAGYTDAEIDAFLGGQRM